MASKNVVLKDGDDALYPTTKIDLIEDGGEVFQSAKKMDLGEAGQLLTVNDNGDGLSWADRFPGSTIVDVVSSENDQAISSKGVYNAINGGFPCSTSLNNGLATYSSIEVSTPYIYIPALEKGSYAFMINESTGSSDIGNFVSFGVHKLTNERTTSTFYLTATSETRIYLLTITFDPALQGTRFVLTRKPISDITTNWETVSDYNLYYQYIN